MITINVNLTASESLEKLLLSALRQAEAAPRKTENEQEAEAPAESEAPGRDEALLGPANEELDKRPAPLNGLTYETEDVRDAMHKARLRIEGSDYKTNAASQGYVAWHDKLTKWFKDKAAELGFPKPSAIPDQENRLLFIKYCYTVQPDEATGKLIQDLPF